MKSLGHVFIIAAMVGGVTYAFEHFFQHHDWPQVFAACAAAYAVGSLHGWIATRRHQLADAAATKV